MDIKDRMKSPAAGAALLCLIIGIAVGLGAGSGRGYERDGVSGSCGASCSGGICEGCQDGGCPMMKKMGGTMGMHQMPDGSMMMNDGSAAGMGSMMMDMTARLEGKKGDALDRVFLADMIVHHQGAVDMAKLLAAGSARPEMQQFAADIIRVQSAEIAQMEAWEKAWFGN